MRCNWIRTFSFLVFVLSCFAGAHAQDNAAITGVVTDSTGAVVPGTAVTLTNSARGLNFTSKTNGEGAYRFPNVPPAPGYKVSFSHDGFTTVTVENFSLVVGATRTQDARLPVGSNQAVEVTSKQNVETLNTTDASLGNNIDVEALNDLPVQNRNTPLALFVLQPGVTQVVAASAGTPAISVTGARTDQNSITVDGMDVNDASTGSTTTVVGQIPVDATQEFRGTVAGLTTSLGTGSGGQFQLVTKSGTNRFHGDLNEYHRDNATIANTWFNNNTLPVTPQVKFIRNQFGGAIGGPVLKDKLFFFADFYNSRIIQAASTFRTVPLDSYRAGNISYLKTGCASTSRQTNNPACIGTYTPDQVKALDPAGIGESPTIFNLINSRYPRANDLSGGDGINTGYFRFTQGYSTIEYDGVARLDYNLTSKQRVFVQFHQGFSDGLQSQNRFAGDPITRPNQNRSYGYVASHIWQIGNNKVNQFYFGDNVQVVSFPLTYNPNGATYVSGFGQFTAPYDEGNIQRRRIPIPTVRDDFNWQIGAHTIGFGGTFKFIKTSNLLVNDYDFYTLGIGGNTTALNAGLRPSDINTGATYTTQWDNAFTLALGRVANISSNYNYNASEQATPQPNGATRRFRYYQTELYVGDTWKVRKDLTLSYGLRYQLYSVPFDAQGAESIPSISFNDYFAARLAQSAASNNSATGVPFITYSLGGSPNNKPGYFQPNLHDLAPRFSFAYNPSYAPRTVINGSADLLYDRTIVNAINFIQNQSSYLFQATATQPYGQTDPTAALKADPRIGGTLTSLPAPPNAPTITTPYTPYVSAAGLPTGLANGNSNSAIDPHLHDPYSIAYNFGLQQEFPGGFIMRASYVGRLGRRLLAQADASQLIDFRDPASGQYLSQAFTQLEGQVRSAPAGTNFKTGTTAIPFFENQITTNFAGYSNRTAVLAANQTANIQLGDITDPIKFLAANKIINYNVGVASQFSSDTFYTNKGFSNYNAMLVTVAKNLNNGLKFDLNYTWSHSVDNVSVVANTVASGSGFICDVLHPRACRGNSDFDVQNIVSSNIVYQLPFGRGRRFLSNAPVALNELIGGWSLSAIPDWQSGLAFTVYTGAYLAGYATNDPAIYDGSRSADTKTHLNKNASNQLLAFANPTAALSHFSAPTGIQYGSRNNLRGPSQVFFDAGLGKTFQVLPDNRLNLVFRADGFNILNHPTFATPTGNTATLAATSTFGVISSQTIPVGGYAYRTGQFALRLEF